MPFAGIRRQTEASSTRAHFFLTHSLAGGTGSGGGSAILQGVRDTYGSGCYITTLSIAPSPSGDVPCQAFNAVLAGTALQACPAAVRQQLPHHVRWLHARF